MSGTRCFTARTRSKYAVAGQLRVDAALHADLGGAELPGLLGAVGDLVEGERVGVGVGAPLGERAEPAADVADVGEVDVPVDDVGDVVADGVAAQVVGEPADLARAGRPRRSSGSARARRTGCPGRPRRPAARRRPRRCERPPRPPVRDGGVLDRVPVAVDVGEVGAPVVGAALGVDGLEQVGAPDARRTRRRAPATAARPGVRRAARARRSVRQRGDVAPRPAGRATARPGGRTPGARSAARAARSRSSAVRSRSRSSEGQGRSGLTWSGVSGETPPQSSTPASSSARHSARSTRLGGAWTRALGPSTSRVTAMAARYSSRPRSSACRIAVSGLARKFWTITSWTAP